MDCPPFETTISSKTRCEKPKCGLRERVNKERTCTRCPDYQNGAPDIISCAEPKCPYREKLMIDGKCELC